MSMRGSKSLLWDALEVFLWGFETISWPTLNRLLGGGDAGSYAISRLIGRLKRDQLVAQMGRGQSARFSITAAGRERMQAVSPRDAWSKGWDGAWRIVLFDLPMARQRDRYRLWRAFRDRRLGLLQRSAWIWPHDLEPILRNIIHAEGVPECFCGFAARDVFLCTDAEIVATAWDWEESRRRQHAYLQQPRLSRGTLARVRNLNELLPWARFETNAYRHAFSLDPLLPRRLWPGDYPGPRVQDRHEQLRQALAERFQSLDS